MFGLSFVILIFFSLVVYRPLKKIINGARYASGNLTHKIDVKSHDEMGYLASTLNYMSGELNKTGEYQRKFVANVSRLPLTADLDQRLCGGNPRRNDSAGNAGKISENRSV